MRRGEERKVKKRKRRREGEERRGKKEEKRGGEETQTAWLVLPSSLKHDYASHLLYGIRLTPGKSGRGVGFYISLALPA